MEIIKPRTRIIYQWDCGRTEAVVQCYTNDIDEGEKYRVKNSGTIMNGSFHTIDRDQIRVVVLEKTVKAYAFKTNAGTIVWSERLDSNATVGLVRVEEFDMEKTIETVKTLK